MRIKNSFRNILFGLGSQLISTILAFMTRTIFIKILSIDYLGINGLFTNILSLLSLANLGFNSAIIFSLYKPLNENNQEEIKAYMDIYSRVYKIVGVSIFIMGICLIPFLSKIVDMNLNIRENIYYIYILFLLDSSISYFYSYKQSILTANQQNFIISKIHTYFIIILNILQCILLIIFKSYLIILISQLIFRLMENIVISKKADKEFPYLNDKNIQKKLSKEKKKQLIKNVYSMFLYKISGTVINSTDNIVISHFVGITYTGIYSNYVLIISTIQTFLSYIFSSITASVGNLIVSNEENKKEFIFKEIFFLAFWIYGICSIAFYILINNFIRIWIGDNYILDNLTVIIIVINFYTGGMQSSSTIYRDTTGLFSVGKYRPIVATIINLVISILLAPILGIAGVILGTIISRLAIYFWVDPYVIYSKIFRKSVKEYFGDYIVKLLLILIIGVVTFSLTKVFNSTSIFTNLIIDIVICLFIPNSIMILIYKDNEYFKYTKNIFKSILNIRSKNLSA